MLIPDSILNRGSSSSLVVYITALRHSSRRPGRLRESVGTAYGVLLDRQHGPPLGLRVLLEEIRSVGSIFLSITTEKGYNFNRQVCRK